MGHSPQIRPAITELHLVGRIGSGVWAGARFYIDPINFALLGQNLHIMTPSAMADRDRHTHLYLWMTIMAFCRHAFDVDGQSKQRSHARITSKYKRVLMSSMFIVVLVVVLLILLLSLLRGLLSSQTRLSSVSKVGAPYSQGWTFRQYFAPSNSIETWVDCVKILERNSKELYGSSCKSNGRGYEKLTFCTKFLLYDIIGLYGYIVRPTMEDE